MDKEGQPGMLSFAGLSPLDAWGDEVKAGLGSKTKLGQDEGPNAPSRPTKYGAPPWD